MMKWDRLMVVEVEKKSHRWIILTVEEVVLAVIATLIFGAMTIIMHPIIVHARGREIIQIQLMGAHVSKFSYFMSFPLESRT
jgi:hypothetical protein